MAELLEENRILREELNELTKTYDEQMYPPLNAETKSATTSAKSRRPTASSCRRSTTVPD